MLVLLDEARSFINVSTDVADEELVSHVKAASKYAEHYTKRWFDANVSRTEYLNGAGTEDILLRAYPIASVTTLNEDIDHDWPAAEDFASTEYVRFDKEGQIKLKDSIFSLGSRNVKVVYKGGYYPFVENVAAASPTATHTIADDLSNSKYDNHGFNVFIKVEGATTGGDVILTGTDIDGNSQTETINMDTDERKASEYEWATLTAVDSSGVTGGTVRVRSTSMPADLRVAIMKIASHFYHESNDKTQEIASRSTASESESYVKGIPQEALIILNSYRSWLP